MAELPSVIGRYEIVTRLGQGGMGSLYLAKDPKIGRLVAIKLVRAEFDSPDARQRFAREAESAGRLRHPNIVTIFDVDEDGGLPFIAMEYIEGETLSEIVRRKGSYPIATKLKWIEHLCSGLAYAHRQGVVHRDIKPANLILDEEGSLKILDFGLARRDASKFTQTQAIIGTPNYMSPEQIRAGDVGPRSDIFAVGAVMYEVLANKEAFPGTVHEAMHKILYEPPQPLNRLVPDLDLAIPAIVARAIEKDPSNRYPDLNHMREDIARARQAIEQHAERGGTRGHSLGDSAATQLLPGSGSHPPPSGRGGSAGSSSTGRVTASSHRATLEKRRAAQIELHINNARKHHDASDLENARTEIERALMFDPDHPAALKLMDDIALEEDRQRIEQLVQRARAELQQGHLEAAEQILGEAAALAPEAAEVRQLRETVETTRREIERARQIQNIIRRARTRFSEGSYEGTLRAVGELLAIDPGNTAARELQARAQQAIDERDHRAQRDSAAQAAVSEARELFEKGDKDSAIRRLERFSPPHDLVAAFLATLRGEQQITDAPAIPTQVIPSTATYSAPPADAISGAPFRRGFAIGVAAAAVLILAGAVYVLNRSDDGAPAQASAPAAAAPTKPATAAPVPESAPPVHPPASLAAKSEQTPADREAMQAYRSLAAGNTAEASQLIARIARRDPRSEHLADLRAQLQQVAATEKEKAKARDQAAAAGQAVPVTPPPTAAPVQSPEPVVPQPAAPQPAAPQPRADQPIAAAPPVSRPDPPAPSPSEVERPAIEAAINEYARALSARDLAAVARVRRYSPEEARNWQNIFKRLKEYRLIVRVTGPPIVTGDRAAVPVDEQFAQTDKSGIQVFTNVRKTEYRLERLGGRWMLLPPG